MGGNKTPRLTTRTSRGTDDIRAHFDAVAMSYHEAHGDPLRLLRYRVRLLRDALRLQPSDRLLEIGCGPADHLLALHASCSMGVGLDLAPRMIARARESAERQGANVRFVLDDARSMQSLGDASFDVAFAVGTIEHIPGRGSVWDAARRVLAPGGRLVLLTVNGDFVWYRRIAPLLGLETRHLSTDEFVDAANLSDELARAGFRSINKSYWRFIPRGDLPSTVVPGLELLDRVGRLLCISSWQGGLLLRAEKPRAQD